MQLTTLFLKPTNARKLTFLYVTKFAKSGLIHTSNFSTLRYVANLAYVGHTAQLWNLVATISYHCTNWTANFSLIACLQIKLCLFKFGKSDVCKISFCKFGHIAMMTLEKSPIRLGGIIVISRYVNSPILIPKLDH